MAHYFTLKFTFRKFITLRFSETLTVIFLKGIGTSARLSELRDIASSNDFVFRLRTYGYLQNLIKKMGKGKMRSFFYIILSAQLCFFLSKKECGVVNKIHYLMTSELDHLKKTPKVI